LLQVLTKRKLLLEPVYEPRFVQGVPGDVFYHARNAHALGHFVGLWESHREDVTLVVLGFLGVRFICPEMINEVLRWGAGDIGRERLYEFVN
jgi:hypothetical protein